MCELSASAKGVVSLAATALLSVCTNLFTNYVNSKEYWLVAIWLGSAIVCFVVQIWVLLFAPSAEEERIKKLEEDNARYKEIVEAPIRAKMNIIEAYADKVIATIKNGDYNDVIDVKRLQGELGI